MEQSAETIETHLYGRRLLADSFLSKGSAFSDDERHRFGLHGLLPMHVSTFEEQLERNYENYRACGTPLEKYVFLGALQDRNETLFYRLVQDHLAEMMPIIYTPTVGEACQRYSHIFRRARGLYVSYPHAERIPEILASYPAKEIDAMVVTDGERILGLGDLGVGGMGIPIGKLALYTLCAGIHPQRTLPVFLDTGTDNPALLKDPLYLGWRRPRVRGADYDRFVDRFVESVVRRWPHIVLQWEDFAKDNAWRLLERHRGRVASFNDDIQGTAAVALAGLIRAGRIAGRTLKEERVLIAGAGSAATGIARLIQTETQLPENIWLVDTQGLVHHERRDLSAEKKPFAQAPEALRAKGLNPSRPIRLMDAVRALQPTTLIGVTGRPGTFDEALVRGVAAHVPRPAIFPLSNPTAHSEALPEQLLHWTSGGALVATGSPFAPVTIQGEKIAIGQCNNAFVFPGVALGLIAAQVRRVPEDAFLTAARVLAAYDRRAPGEERSLFPALADVRDISRKIAVQVGKTVLALGLSRTPRDAVALTARVRELMWNPVYPTLRFKQNPKDD